MALRTRPHESHGPSHERWLLTYADLITLLLVFFIVMFSISSADLEKFALLNTSMQQAFNVGVLQGNDATAAAGMGGQRGQVETSPIQTTIRPDPVQNDYAIVNQQIARLIEARGLWGYLEVRQTAEGVVIGISGALLFDSGKVDLRPEATEVLAEVAKVLRPLPNPLRIDAHTDNIPTDSPTYPTNWELSAARAVSVARFLIEEGGIQPERVAAAGYAEYRPIASNDTRENRARNRRAEILVQSVPPPKPEGNR